MKALCWTGVNEPAVETVADPKILNAHDVIVKVRLTHDLRVGPAPARRLHPGHARRRRDRATSSWARSSRSGPGCTKHQVGDRVVVCSFIGCGQCWYCTARAVLAVRQRQHQPGDHRGAVGLGDPGGFFGYSHAMGGFAGSHAEYVRVPFADHGAFPVPEGSSDLSALFASDAVPTGWMGADLGRVRPGDTVAVWGAGGVGQMAARAAMLLGAEQVIVIDRLPERLAHGRDRTSAPRPSTTPAPTSVAELRERTGGRGPDVCIEAVGMEAHSSGPQYLYDKVKQQLRLQTDRPDRAPGGDLRLPQGRQSVFALGRVRRAGRQVPARGADEQGPDPARRPAARAPLHPDAARPHRRAARSAPSTSPPTSCRWTRARSGYDMFKNKEDGCVRAVFHPSR